MGGLRRLCKLVAEAMWLVVEAMCWVDNYSINNTTSCPILQAEAIQIFSYAEISRWTKCGKKRQCNLIRAKEGVYAPPSIALQSFLKTFGEKGYIYC